jgi:membrane protease YdiL (CAAX protease family)
MFETLQPDLSWQENDLMALLPILLTTLFFSVYWFTAQSEKIRQRFFNRYDFDEASTRHIFFTKYFGFISMGIVPLAISLVLIKGSTLDGFGLTCIPETTSFTLIWIAGLTAFIVPLVSLSARKPGNLVNYPQIRARIWTRRTVLINITGWVLYLFGYEVLFRGVLLFPVAEAIGIWPAIAINIALYSATHIPKGLGETIGAGLLGLVLCILTLQSGTIWIAFIVHVAMALTNSFTALKHHPDMQFIKRK